MISTSEGCAEHQFAGQNTQHPPNWDLNKCLPCFEIPSYGLLWDGGAEDEVRMGRYPGCPLPVGQGEPWLLELR